MHKTIEIFQVNDPKTGIGKTGKAWSMTECECIVNSADGKRAAGVLLLGRGIDASKVVPGLYVGTFDIGIDYKTRKIGAEIVNLQPFVAPKSSPSSGPAVVRTA